MFYPIVRTTALRACVERGHAALSDFPRKMLVKAFLCKRQVYTRIKSCFRCRSLRWTDAQFQGAQDSAWNGDSCLLARKPGIGLRAPTLRGGFILGTGVGLFFVSPFYERRNKPTLRGALAQNLAIQRGLGGPKSNRAPASCLSSASERPSLALRTTCKPLSFLPATA